MFGLGVLNVGGTQGWRSQGELGVKSWLSPLEEIRGRWGLGWFYLLWKKLACLNFWGWWKSGSPGPRGVAVRNFWSGELMMKVAFSLVVGPKLNFFLRYFRGMAAAAIHEPSGARSA